MPFYYYFDPTMLIVIPALIFAFWAQINVSSTYSKYNKMKTSGGVPALKPQEGYLMPTDFTM